MQEELPTAALWKIAVWRRKAGNSRETQGHWWNILNFDQTREKRTVFPSSFPSALLATQPQRPLAKLFLLLILFAIKKNGGVWVVSHVLLVDAHDGRCTRWKVHHVLTEVTSWEAAHWGQIARKDANKRSVSQSQGISSLMRFFRD